MKTETIIESICSFLKLTCSPRKANMEKDNIHKNTVIKLNHKRDGKERTLITTQCANRRYSSNGHRDGIIVNERCLNQRQIQISKMIDRAEQKMRNSVFFMPIKLTK